MNEQIHSLWQESFKLVSNTYAHATKIPKSDVIGLKKQLEQTGMEYMNHIAEIASCTKVKDFRIKLSEAQILLSQISSLLSIIHAAFALSDLKLQVQITLIKNITYRVQDTLLIAPARKIA